MNERLMRVAPGSFAKFVTAFEEQKAVPKPGTQITCQDSLLWLVSLQVCTGPKGSQAASACPWPPLSLA